MGTQGTGRKRSTKKERSTAEDDALNLIAREAEARLAAKRAARAEAREIRMKELERQQKEIFQVQKKYYGLDTKLDDRSDSKWGDIEQWMEDSERYSRSSRIHTLSDDDERMSVGSRGSVRSDLDAVGAYGGGGSSSHSEKKSKKKKKHKHKDRDKNGCDDEYSVISSRSSRLSDESRVSRSSRLDLTSSRPNDDSRVSRSSRLDLQPVGGNAPASYASSDLYSFNGLSSSRNPGSPFNGYQPVEYTSYRSSSSRASSRASSARASPVDNCGSVASFLRSAASGSGLSRGLDDVTIPDFSDVDDRDYLEKGSRAASALTAGTFTSLGGSSSRRGSGETSITVDAETSIREIKEIHELKDQIQDVESKYTQNLKEVKDALAEVEEKYRKAMVSNAQLDNEKNNLMYQVDTLKDSLMELEELLSETQRGYDEKVKECEREKHAHSVLQFQFNEMKETLKQSEELINEIRQLRIKQDGFVREISDLQETVEWKDKKIGALERQKEYTDAIRIERDELREESVKLKDILKKHGIVLGPDLNINGDIGEAEVDGSPSADPASQTAPASQTSPTEGNSMLGNAEETQLRSSGEEEVDPEQHGDMFEEAKDNHLSPDALCNVAGVSNLETSSKEQLTEDQQTFLATEKDNVEESDLSKDLNVDINDHSITEAKNIIVCSSGLQGIIKSSEENVPETETPEGGDLGEMCNPDFGEKEIKSSSVDTHSDDIREQENKQEDVEESNRRNTESCPQQNIAQDVMKESLPDESTSAVSNTNSKQELENAKEAENDEAEETSSKPTPQGATASGKKKKKKRKGKKKGGTQENMNQQKEGTDKDNGNTAKDIKSATKDHKQTTEPEVYGQESKVDQVKKEQDRQETEDVDGVEALKPSETFSHNDTVKESTMDHVKDEHHNKITFDMDIVEEIEALATSETFSYIETPKEIRADHVTDKQNWEQSLKNETVEAVETVAPPETFSHAETLKKSRTDPRKDEQDEEQTVETEKVEELGFMTSPVTETDLSTPDHIDNSKGAESTDGLDQVCTSSVENSKHGTDISANGNVIHTESETVDNAEEEVGSVDEMKFECTNNNPENTFETNSIEKPEAESHVPSQGDAAADESDGDDTPIEVSERDPEEATEPVKDDQEPGAETEQESFSPSVIPSSQDGDHSELKPDKTEMEELNRDLRGPEGLVEPDSSSHDQKSESLMKNLDAFDTEKNLLETLAQAEQVDGVEFQTMQCEDQIDESNAEASIETEEINTGVNTSDSSQEATEIGSSIEKDHSTEESAVAPDAEHKNSPNDRQSETHLFPLAEQLPEPSKDKSEDNDSSQPTLEDGDEEDGEDEEGQSFDFDDMDVEVAIETNLPINPKEEEVEEAVEVMSDQSNNGNSRLCQSDTESNENTQDAPVKSNDEKCTIEGGNQVDTLDKESDTMPEDNQNSPAQEDTASEKGENVCGKQKSIPEEVGVADESMHVTEEGKVLSIGELGVVEENINQTMSLPVEEGLEAIAHELQGEDLVLPKSADQAAINKEAPQAGKDMKKNSKKGKGKGKEDCKMS